jgi:hypothetical protein
MAVVSGVDGPSGRVKLAVFWTNRQSIRCYRSFSASLSSWQVLHAYKSSGRRWMPGAEKRSWTWTLGPRTTKTRGEKLEWSLGGSMGPVSKDLFPATTVNH